MTIDWENNDRPLGFVVPIFRHPNIICASDWLNWWWKELASLLPEDWADYHDPAHVNDYNNLKDFE